MNRLRSYARAIGGVLAIVAILVGFILTGSTTITAQSFSAQIQQFWNQLRTGALVFTHLNTIDATCTGTCTGFGGGGGGGTPGGAASAIQFKIDASTFGGSNWLASANVMFLQPADYLTENGPFAVTYSAAAHDPMERRDDIVSFGWNVGNVAAGQGSTALVLEAYCGPSVGCSLPGQTETYFSLDDGMGNSTRPIGMFQSFDGTGQTSGIFRFDTLTMFDREQSFPIFTVSDVMGAGSVSLHLSVLSSDVTSGDVFLINGAAAVGFASSAVQIGHGGSNVTFAGGGDGSAIVKVGSNHFQLSNPSIEDATGQTLISMSTDGPFIGTAGITGDGEMLLALGGASADLGWNIKPKGNGNIRLNTENSGSGAVYFQTTSIKVGGFPGVDGITSSGTSCAITAITAGIITGATCTP